MSRVGYSCDECDETFDTLTAKRLHDCPGGSTGDEEFSLDGMDDDERAEKITQELLRCERCGEQNPAEAVEEADKQAGPDQFGVTFEFACVECGFVNSNTAELGG